MNNSSLTLAALKFFDERMVASMSPLDGLGEWLKECKQTPESYFRFMREQYANHPGIVSPRTLVKSRKVFDHFIEYRGRTVECAKLDAELDLESFQARVARGMDPMGLLEDESLDFSPVFRWAMSTTLGMFGTALKWRERAIEAIAEAPERAMAFQGKLAEAVAALEVKP